MKTEVKANPTEGKTDAPEIFHAYNLLDPMPRLSLCKQSVRGKLVDPLPDNATLCIVCMDLFNKPVD